MTIIMLRRRTTEILLFFLLTLVEVQCFFVVSHTRTTTSSRTHDHDHDLSSSSITYPNGNFWRRTNRGSQLWMTTDSPRMGELTIPEQKVYEIMKNVHDSKYKFRVVVVGKGAILEATSVLGPKLSVSQSPSSGANLLTLASADQSFEYHLQLSQVSKMVLLRKETPSKVMRIIRILNDQGESMSSLILADESDAAVKWFTELGETYGTDIQL